MATKKPVRRVAAPRPSDTLMGNQDLRHKGDSTARKKGKCVTFWVTDEQKQHDGLEAHHRGARDAHEPRVYIECIYNLYRLYQSSSEIDLAMTDFPSLLSSQ